MKLSYNWLQTYFEDILPEPEKLAELLTFHAYEVEEIVPGIDEDHVLDIDILPNRASDSLCHRGVAREVGSLLEIETIEKHREPLVPEGKNVIPVHIEEPSACRRYIAKVIEGVSVGKSPQWLEKRITSIEERSINGIVDVTNFVLFDIGQPLHAFDLDKIEGGEIHVRYAEKGEKLTTLDGVEVTFEGGELVIADVKDPIAIAGVKGGKKAEIDEHTNHIVLEAANFNPVTVRKTARKFGILTDASKRFENDITPHLAKEGIERAAALIHDLPGNEQARVSDNTDVYEKLPQQHKTGVSVAEINTLLGTQMLAEEVEEILTHARLTFEQVADPAASIVSNASRYVGTPYRYGASVTYDAPNEFDCSSFLSFLFIQAGISLPRMAIDQYVYGESVSEDDMKPGDIIFSRNEDPKEYTFRMKHDGTEVTHAGAKETSEEFLSGTTVPGGVSHNGLYIGEGNVIHAHPEKGVVIEALNDSEKFKTIVGVRRIPEAQSDRYVVSVPYDRLDIRTPADVIEEVGRMYGYRSIDSVVPQDALRTEINKSFFYASVVRSALAEIGFSEIYTYSFQKEGDVEIANPLTKDRSFLRTDLRRGISEALHFNEKHAPLLGATDCICVFEIGTVFRGGNEYMSLGIGARALSGKKKESRAEDMVRQAQEVISKALGIEIHDDVRDGITEISFDDIVGTLPQPKEKDYSSVLPRSSDHTFTPISPYPFVLRDVAVWTPADTKKEAVAFLIKEYAGDMLAREPICFDVFEKEGRVSYAFNLVFQSPERTLTDEEVNAVMDNIYKAMEQKDGWEVR